MVDSINQAQIIQFSDMVHHEAQQLQSRLKPYAMIKQMTGDVFAYDGLGEVEAREVVGRNQPATFEDIAHNRRKIARKRFIINLPVDSKDVRGALLDIDSEYAKSVAAGMVRQYDRVLAEAAFASVLTGRDFETTLTADADGVDVIDALSGLTYEKLLEVKQAFIDSDVGLDMNEKLFLTITGKENTSLMKEDKLTSGDFVRNMTVEGGEAKSGAGFEFVHFAANATSPILEVEGSSTRRLIAASSRGLCLGISKEMSITVTERDDLIETHQVQAIIDIGAVRTEGNLVKEVQTTV